MEKKPSEILEQALKIFGPNGENWTKGHFRKFKILDKMGNIVEKVSVLSKEQVKAECYCSLGAMDVAADPSLTLSTDLLGSPQKNKIARRKAENYLKAVISKENCHSVPGWNDNSKRTFTSVKKAFQEAIELAKKDEQNAA